MRDVDFVGQLLALEEPWRVHQVTLAPKDKRLDVSLEHRQRATFCCSECGQASPIYDHLPSRSWRHLDHGEFLTWLHARVPRVSCPEHGVRQVQIPWSLPGARFTLPFERHAIDTLLEADVLGASRLLNLSWDEAWHVMERAVARGLQWLRATQRPDVGAIELERDRADVPMERRVQRRRAPHARHDEERDGGRHADAEHHPVEIVVVVGRHEVRAAVGQVLGALHAELKPALERAAQGRPQRAVQQGEPGPRATDIGTRRQRGRARHFGIYSMLPRGVLPPG